MQSDSRACLFMPFDALKGFKEALEEVERRHDERVFLSDDIFEALNQKVIHLKRGKKVKIKYYDQERYLEIIGIVDKVDEVNHWIYLRHTRIFFDDIVMMEIIDSNLV